MKHLLFLTLLSPLALVCQEDACLVYGDQLDLCQCPAGYGQPAGIVLDRCIDIFVSADFIYWSPKRRLRGDILKYQNNAENTIHMMDEVTGYGPGFKVGLGTNLPCFDNWTLRACYTRYHHDFTDTFRTSDNETLSFLLPPLALIQFTQVHSKLTFNYDDLRLFIERPVYLSTRLILNPHFTLRGTINEINQHQRFDLPPASILPGRIGADFQDTRFKTWSVDMCAGGYGYLLLGCGFRLVFEGEVGVGYFRVIDNHQTVVNNSTFNLGATVIKNDFLKKPRWLGPVGTAGGGLSWGTYFCDQQYHLDLSILYEFEAQWGPFLYDNLAYVIYDFHYRGLTVNAQFDF